MPTIVPSYITKNRLGIYIFQYKIPKIFRDRYPELKILFRKSLGTRDRRTAIKIARKLAVIMDDLAYKYFDNPEAFGKAMELLMKYEKLTNQMLDFSAIEEQLYIEFDEYDDYLLEKAIGYQSEIKNNKNTIQKEIDYLKAINLNLSKGSSIGHEAVDNTLPLNELFDKWKASAKGRMKKSSYGEYVRMISFFIRVVTEYNQNIIPTVSSINEDMVRYYKEILDKIPKHAKTETVATVEELIKQPGERKRRSTVKNTLTNVGHFIKWAEKERYIKNRDIHPLIIHHPIIKSRHKKKRVPLDELDLGNLFNSHYYINGVFKRSSDYWIPLIALFTGCTLSEIAQLYTHDVKGLQGIDVIDINDNDDKELKVSESDVDSGRPRVIPVHKKLIELGLIDFADHRKKSEEKRLFPAEKRNNRGQFGPYSNRFARLRKECGIMPRNDKEFRDFHSFRHLMKTKLSDIEMNEGIIDDILGHSSRARSTVGQGYNHSDRLRLKHELINKIEFKSIDFSKIKSWKEIRFKDA